MRCWISARWRSLCGSQSVSIGDDLSLDKVHRTTQQIETHTSEILRVATTNLQTCQFSAFQTGSNAPVTFQCLIMVIFRDHIGHFIYVYLDDIFISSDTLEEHELHLQIVFQILEEADFHLEQEKNLYTERLNYLGHIIDQRSIHANRDKMSWIHNCDFDTATCWLVSRLHTTPLAQELHFSIYTRYHQQFQHCGQYNDTQKQNLRHWHGELTMVPQTRKLMWQCWLNNMLNHRSMLTLLGNN